MKRILCFGIATGTQGKICSRLPKPGRAGQCRFGQFDLKMRHVIDTSEVLGTPGMPEGKLACLIEANEKRSLQLYGLGKKLSPEVRRNTDRLCHRRTQADGASPAGQ